MNIDKKMKGQFFTITNPFNHDLMFKWIDLIEDFKDKVLLEPFAGSNNIIDMIEEIGYRNSWKCYDIDPECTSLTEDSVFQVETRDTLASFPMGYEVAITNPPYLSKSSATRSDIVFPETTYNDLYKFSLDRMLENTKYVAAIIPESFLTQGLFHNRLFGVVSLTMKMFEDTSCPVCLALFIPEEDKEDINDFLIYSNERLIGNYVSMKEELSESNLNIDFKFNDPNGEIGLLAIDNTRTDSIKFVSGETIESDKIKTSSRSITRIKIDNQDINIELLIAKANEILFREREKTSDLFFTAFKGLRTDGKYRRRLDFKNAKRILNKAIEEVSNDC